MRSSWKRMDTSSKFFRVIACEALASAVEYFATRSPHRIDVTLQEIGLHDRPTGLREHLQQLIDLDCTANIQVISESTGNQKMLDLV